MGMRGRWMGRGWGASMRSGRLMRMGMGTGGLLLLGRWIDGLVSSGLGYDFVGESTALVLDFGWLHCGDLG